MANVLTHKGKIVQDPPLVHWLVNNPRAGWVWVLPRIWLGVQWLQAAQHKIGSPQWVQTGDALKGYWLNAVQMPATGSPPIAFDWYRSFLQTLLDAQAYTWFAKLVAYGELLIGIALIIGAFTGIAAAFGGLMNWNYMMAGSASTNPVLFIVAVGLIVAWKVSGYIGADYFLLRWIGTPWRGRSVKAKSDTSAATAEALSAWADDGGASESGPNQ
ncbi:thiosulfate dehydrogenase [quinone] large subunit [Thermoflexales bacterium]|nr:thiosulfate dehydrogenase [quinone] large subunit [Thermoflexales bacterium]